MNAKLSDAQILANEQFFTKTINSLHEGGVYGWPAISEVFTVRGGKLCGSERGLMHAKHIVSETFFNNHFEKL
jgi:hypothetical protein